MFTLNVLVFTSLSRSGFMCIGFKSLIVQKAELANDRSVFAWYFNAEFVLPLLLHCCAESETSSAHRQQHLMYEYQSSSNTIVKVARHLVAFRTGVIMYARW